MKTRVSSLLAIFVLAAQVLSVLALVAPASTSAHEGEDHEHEETTSTAYEYTAQAGDSYTKLARKAVQTYGIDNNVNLSGAEIVFAETSLTAEAKLPAVNQGQKINITKDTVKKWVEAAQKLDDATEARWNYYVQFVDFNTNNVGEVRS